MVCVSCGGVYRRIALITNPFTVYNVTTKATEWVAAPATLLHGRFWCLRPIVFAVFSVPHTAFLS